MRIGHIVMITAATAWTVCAACVSAQTPASGEGSGPAFDSARAFRHLEALVAIGPRPAGSAGAARARDYIKRELSAVGLTPVEQRFPADTPAGEIAMVNITATIKGPGAGRLLFAGHYDTKRFEDITFVGANDGGSSTAFLLELARVLASRQNALTIELVFFDGEEAIGEWETGNTYGSRYYVNDARRTGTLKDIKALVLVDMIGDADLTIKRESSSTAWLTDAIWTAARRLKRPEFLSESLAIDDDHIPFLRAGVPAVDIIDFAYPEYPDNRYWHTAEDTLDKVSAKSLQAVGDVLLEALPAIELRVR
jgi:Zn-dependent M28 family amino/carboxypeptidase